MWRFNDAELNCVITKIFFKPELRQLLIGTSISRYLPPSGTAGFDRSWVRGNRRLPAPPARMIDRTCVGFSLLFRIIWVLIVAYFILKLIDSALNRLHLIISSSDVIGVARVEQRTETLRHIIRGVAKGILILVVAFEVGGELGFNLDPVLASASI